MKFRNVGKNAPGKNSPGKNPPGKTPPFGEVGKNPLFGKGEERDDYFVGVWPTRPFTNSALLGRVGKRLSCPVITLLTILLTIFHSLSFLYSSIYDNEI
jgi:hypothetical protein